MVKRRARSMSLIRASGWSRRIHLWERAIAEDFADLRKVGPTNPMMEDIEKGSWTSRADGDTDGRAICATDPPPTSRPSRRRRRLPRN